jgi:ferric-dicitrate binding protein FerR (iron transport regulator)
MFDNQTLQEVADEFNRYNRVKLVIEGELRSVSLSGTFDVDDPKPIIGFVVGTPSLQAETARVGDEILIRRREP